MSSRGVLHRPIRKLCSDCQNSLETGAIQRLETFARTQPQARPEALLTKQIGRTAVVYFVIVDVAHHRKSLIVFHSGVNLSSYPYKHSLLSHRDK